MALTIEQRKARRLGIGGSDIAAIVGISRWATPLDVYLEKISTEDPYEEEGSLIGPNPKEWGNIMEPIIIKQFETIQGVSCITGLDVFVHPQYDYMRANIDAKVVGENAILECKTAGQYASKEWSSLGGDNIPEPYLLQCAYYAEIVDVSKVYIAVLIGGNDFRIYHYERNPKLGQLVLDKAHNFWNNHVLKRIPPEPINLEDACKLWRDTLSDNVKEISPDVELIIKDLRALKAQEKVIRELYNEKQAQICAFMQEDIAIKDAYGQLLLTWKPQISNRFDSTRFKADHPEMYALYTKTMQSRVFKLRGEIE